MKTRIITLFLAAFLCLHAYGSQDIRLPVPKIDGGKPLMQALKERKSQRALSDKELPAQVLGDLLWAACGQNRPDGRRTAPTAKNWQEIDVYVAMKSGLYLYDAPTHSLKMILASDKACRPSS